MKFSPIAVKVVFFMFRAFFVFFCLCVSSLANAQTFAAKLIEGVPANLDGAIDVGDYDQDGDLDFAVMGQSAHIMESPTHASGGVGFTGIYKNTNGSFTLLSGLNLLEVRYGDIAWGDFDNDHDLDLIVSGHPTGPNAINTKALALYRNNGNDSFEAVATSIIPFHGGEFELVDFDKDGLLDIGVTGFVEGQFSSVGFSDVYKNYGNFNFQRMNLNIAQVASGTMSFIDIENDGDWDVILNGWTNEFIYKTFFYLNSNNALTLTPTVLDDFWGAILGVHDLNNDGFQDVVISGTVAQAPYPFSLRIYMNNQGTLQANQVALDGLKEGSIDFADFDRDQDVDLLLTGASDATGLSFKTKIIRNDNGVFTILPNEFEGSFRGGAMWGDYDLDGDYDFIKFPANTVLYSQCGNVVEKHETICSGTSFLFHGQSLTQSGTYIQTIQTADGCTSEVKLFLTVAPPIQSSHSATICSGTTYMFYGTELTAAGVYTKTFETTTGCDSLATLTLTVTPPIQSSLAATICSGTTFLFDGTELTTTGVYTRNFKTTTGCDSLATLTLTVTPPIQSSLTATICAGTTYQFDGTGLSAAGVYTKSFKTTAGCDSVVQVTLTVTELNTLIEQEGSHLRAVENDVDYQWYDCQRQMMLEGEDDKIFKVMVDGLYAVIIKKGECESRSDCLEAISIFENYPNPAHDEVKFKLSDVAQNIEVRMFDAAGILVATWTLSNTQEFVISIASFPDGQYFFEVIADGKVKTSRVIKKGK